MTTTITITPAEVVRRRQIIEDVRRSSELEGARSTDEVRAVQDQWVAGTITRDDMRARVLELTAL